MATSVIMPKQGQSVESCIIGKWHKKTGDKVSAGDILFTYETDKATFDEQAKAEGVLLAVFYEEGDDVQCLKTVCVIGEQGESYDELIVNSEESEVSKERSGVEGEVPGVEKRGTEHIGGPTTPNPALQTPTFEPNSQFANTPHSLRISPRARKLVEKTGADASRAVPTGANNRIMEADIQRVIEQGHFSTRAAFAQDVQIPSDTAGTGIGGRITTYDNSGPGVRGSGLSNAPGFEEVKLTNVRKFIANAMHTSLSQSAQLTHHTSFDASDIMDFRKKLKALAAKEAASHPPAGDAASPLSPSPNPCAATITDIIIYAVSRVLLRHRSINAHFLGDKMALYNNAHIGIAVDTPRGLLVPTLLRADTLTLGEISSHTKVMFDKCKTGSIEPDALKGASFTISNLGTMGIEMFTPILNPPQTGILGVCSIVERTKDGGKFYPAMGLSLTYDHRALDGADASRFLKDLVTFLEDFTFYLAVDKR